MFLCSPSHGVQGVYSNAFSTILGTTKSGQNSVLTMNRASTTKGKGQHHERQERQRYILSKERAPQLQRSTIRRGHRGWNSSPRSKGFELYVRPPSRTEAPPDSLLALKINREYDQENQRTAGNRKPVFFFSPVFSELLPWHVEVPRLGV